MLHSAAGNSALIEIIRKEIEADGPITFARFMEQALYHPEYGYYASDRASIGRAGDYFTNVSVGPIFGQLFTAQFAEIWEQLGQPDNFVIVEQGAHHGQFARDVLDSARSHFPNFASSLRYRIVEPFPRLHRQQARTLEEFGGQVEWCASLKELAPFVGIHFSNELLDAMPVQLLVSTKDGWNEKFVGLEREEFAFVEQPIVDSRLKEIAATLPKLAPGHEIEISLAALDWIADVSTKLDRGIAFIVDYGFLRDDFYDPQMDGGTIQARAEHRRLKSPFENLGHADITAHVNWTSLAAQAKRCGLEIAGFTDQHHFFTGIISRFESDLEKLDAKAKRELKTLLHPEMLGRRFQVLALAKDARFLAPHSGFKFARDAATSLGL